MTRGYEGEVKHLVKTHPAGKANSANFTIFTDEIERSAKSSDAAHFPGGNTPKVVRLLPDAREAEVAHILRRSTYVLPVGAQSSLTGAATPEGAVVLDMSYQNRILGIRRNSVIVQPGVTISQLQKALAERGLYYAPGPTYQEATIAGTVSTNASGAATFKYGSTRPWVDALRVVLANGEMLEVARGQYLAHPGGYFELKNAAGIRTRRIPIPTYRVPDVAKVSVGYPAKPGMDLIDLFTGSEGTLGVITEVTLRVIPKPSISWALIPCRDEEQALDVTKILRDHSLETRRTRNPAGIDASAIEYMDERSLVLLRKDGKTREGTIPNDAKTLVLVQLELPRTPDLVLERFAGELDRLGLLGNAAIAMPDNRRLIEYFISLREGVPMGVNERIGRAKLAAEDNGITKVAGDPIVPFEYLGQMLKIYRSKLDELGLDYAIWGHISDGNMHPNVLPRTYAEVIQAQRIILESGLAVIGMGGSPMAEHGVGRNPHKQTLLTALYGEEGINQMRAIKQTLDPEWKLAPGNIFSQFQTYSPNL